MKPKFPTKYIAFTTYFSATHQAVDIPNGVTVNNQMMDNKPVYMTHDAKVITNSYASDYGYFIEYEYYENGDRFVVGDGHFNNKSELQVGQTYKQGTFINYMGSTGTSSAVHDHHRLSKNGTRVNPLDYEYVYPDQVVGQYEDAHLNYYTPGNEVNVYYRVRTEANGWLPEVRNLDDYAGYNDSPVTAVAIKVDKGSIRYRVHLIDGGWLGWVNGYDINDLMNGYAGNGQRIDLIQIYYETPDDIRPYKYAKYKVNGYDWQVDTQTGDGMDGFAGNYGYTLKKLWIEIV